MVEIRLRILYQGKARIVKDWIVHGFNVPKAGEIARSLGLGAEHEAKKFKLSQQISRLVRVLLKTEHDQKYGWQNKVEKYMSTGLGLGHDIPPKPGNTNYPKSSDATS